MFDISYLLYNVIRAFVPDGTAFGPSGMDIGHGKAPDKVPGKTVAAMSDGISFHETGTGNVPIVCADGYLVAQHGTGFGATESFAVANAQRLKNAVKSGSADGEQFIMHPGSKPANGLLVERQPERYSCFKSIGAHVISGSPDAQNGLEKNGVRVSRFSAALALSAPGRLMQKPNGVFAVVAANGAEFIENEFFVFAGSFCIALMNGLSIGMFFFVAHRR